MTFFNSMFESYDWQSSLIALLAIAILTKLLKLGIFKHPEANAMKQRNHELDKKKLVQEKYQRVVMYLDKVLMISFQLSEQDHGKPAPDLEEREIAQVTASGYQSWLSTRLGCLQGGLRSS